jgi:hypothetical protein
MALPEWREEAITKKHGRKGFDCGERALNDFLHLNARQSHERRGAKTFVAVGAGDGKTVHGYYSLSPASTEYASLPDTVRRGFGRYDVGAYRLSHLVVSVAMQGQGMGGQLLLAAVCALPRKRAEWSC